MAGKIKKNNKYTQYKNKYSLRWLEKGSPAAAGSKAGGGRKEGRRRRRQDGWPAAGRMRRLEVASNVWWLSFFLARSFFRTCRDHINNLGTHQNKYCINCEMAACQRCVSEGLHSDHRVITIYRLVRNDVVAVDEMRRHIDCSGIQPYTSNRRLVLALHPLPHCNSGQLKPQISCLTCTRKLMVPSHYDYCSIACKMENGKIKPKKRTVKPPAPDYGADGDARAGAGKDWKRSCLGTGRHKGVPIRAPLF